MKLSRFAALALIAVIAVAAMSFFSMQAMAQTPDPATPIAQNCDDDAEDTTEAADSGEDLDNVEEECGPQDEAGDATENEAEDASGAEAAEDEAEGPDAALTGSVLEQASAAALDYVGEGQVTGTESGDEEGAYEVEVTLDNGQQVDVHLDANFNVLGQSDDVENGG
jgi:hypothetical protein